MHMRDIEETILLSGQTEHDAVSSRGQIHAEILARTRWRWRRTPRGPLQRTDLPVTRP